MIWPFKLPTALARAEEHLAEAQLELLNSRHNREHWTSTEAMLTKRVARLKLDVKELKNGQDIGGGRFDGGRASHRNDAPDESGSADSGTRVAVNYPLPWRGR